VYYILFSGKCKFGFELWRAVENWRLYAKEAYGILYVRPAEPVFTRPGAPSRGRAYRKESPIRQGMEWISRYRYFE
jgi:hypothetical protein